MAVTKKFDIATQNLQVPPAMQKNVVNSSQSNYTTENYLHIASIIIILNNGYLILKICHVLRLYIGSCISHVLDFLSAMFDEGHVKLTVQLTVQYVQ